MPQEKGTWLPPRQKFIMLDTYLACCIFSNQTNINRDINKTRRYSRAKSNYTLVKLLSARYCADSWDTRWTKPLPAACPSQRRWALSLNLASSASRLAISSSTH